MPIVRSKQSFRVRQESTSKTTTSTVSSVLLHASNGKPYNGWEFWLADERNLIPARVIAYGYRWSSTLPSSDKYVYEWQELGEGIWCPKKFHVTRYDSDELRLGRKTVSWKKHFTIEQATLSPAIDADTFAAPYPTSNESFDSIMIRSANLTNQRFELFPSVLRPCHPRENSCHSLARIARPEHG